MCGETSAAVHALARRRRLPAPAEQVVVYELTEEGAALSDAVAALARWGQRTLPSTADGRVFRARWLILPAVVFAKADTRFAVSSRIFRAVDDRIYWKLRRWCRRRHRRRRCRWSHR